MAGRAWGTAVAPTAVQETADAARWLGMPKERFQDRLRHYRRAAGLTQAELADLMGGDKGHIGTIEASKKPYEPSRDFVRRAAKALKIKPWQLEDEDFRPEMPVKSEDAVSLDEELKEEDRVSVAHLIKRLKQTA